MSRSVPGSNNFAPPTAVGGGPPIMPPGSKGTLNSAGMSGIPRVPPPMPESAPGRMMQNVSAPATVPNRNSVMAATAMALRGRR